MKLNDTNKNYIDSLDYEEMLRKWRFAGAGDELFCGETGDYFSKRMKKLKSQCDHVAISKKVGWDKL
jgi:hypothetical protein